MTALYLFLGTQLPGTWLNWAYGRTQKAWLGRWVRFTEVCVGRGDSLLLATRARPLPQKDHFLCLPPYRVPSVYLSHGAAIGTLAACSLATAGHRRCACGLRTRPRTDVDPLQFLPRSNCRRRRHIVSRYLVVIVTCHGVFWRNT